MFSDGLNPLPSLNPSDDGVSTLPSPLLGISSVFVVFSTVSSVISFEISSVGSSTSSAIISSVVIVSVSTSVSTLLLITGVSFFPHAERVNAVMQNMINKFFLFMGVYVLSSYYVM